MVKLSDLLEKRVVPEELDPIISGLAIHSREVKPGNLFFALKGIKDDGARYLDEAINNGAVAVLADQPLDAPRGIAVVCDENPRQRLSLIAARFFGSQPEKVVAVTGTNGKTSVAWFVAQLWKELGIKGASVGTLGILSDSEQQALNLTTPQPVELCKNLANLAQSGIDHAVVEASSHGLEQHRLDGTRITAAAFTNLSHDHFDYHLNTESYFNAKMRLFREVMDPGGVAVINADSHYYPEVANICREFGHEIISYGRHGGKFRIINHRANGISQYLDLEIDGEPINLRLPLVGDFQAWNILCALGLVVGSGGDLDQALSVLTNLRGVPGRLQSVAEVNGARIFVDYAHTPDALESCLTALRLHAQKHLTVVFGCGGDRDRGKRSKMGHAACTLADRVIITDDNPRDEDPSVIRQEIMIGCSDNAVEVAGRDKAIEMAIAGLGEGDILLIAGKGHETSQIIGKNSMPFDDALVAKDVAEEFARVES